MANLQSFVPKSQAVTRLANLCGDELQYLSSDWISCLSAAVSAAVNATYNPAIAENLPHFMSVHYQITSSTLPSSSLKVWGDLSPIILAMDSEEGMTRSRWLYFQMSLANILIERDKTAEN